MLSAFLMLVEIKRRKMAKMILALLHYIMTTAKMWLANAAVRRP